MNRDSDERSPGSTSSIDADAFHKRCEASIDWAVLEQLNALSPRGSTELFAVKAAKLYLTSTSHLVTAMQAAFAVLDAEAVRLAVHTLKSSSRTMGAQQLAHLAEALEMRAGSGSLTGAGQMVTDVAEEYRCACAALEQFIDRQPGTAG